MKYRLLISFINTIVIMLPFIIIFSDYKTNKIKVVIIGTIYSLLYFLDIYFFTLPLWIREITLFVLTYLFIQSIYRFNHKLIFTTASIFFILNNLAIIISSPFNELVSENLYVLLLSLVKIVLTFMVAEYLNKYIKEYSDKLLQRNIITVLPMIIVFEFLYIQFIHNSSFEINIIIVVYCICITLVFFLVKKYFVSEEKLEQTQLVNTNNQKIINESKQYESDKEKYNQEKHDLIAKLATIKVEIEENNKDIAIKYLDELTGNVTSKNEVYFSPVKEINNILNLKVKSNPKIRINYQSNVVSLSETMIMDIIVIFSNLVDNAIDEIERADYSDNEIRIILKHNNHNYAISVENRLYNYKSLNTEKEDMANHGYGLKIVKKTIERYNGIIKIEQNINFKVIIVLFAKQSLK